MGYRDDMFNYACQLEENGRSEEAAAVYESMLFHDTPDAPACINLGTIRFREGRYEEAEKLYRRAVVSEPSNILALFNLSNVLDTLGHLEEAEQLLRKTIKIAPRYANAHFNLAFVLMRAGKPRAALPYWKEYARLEPADPSSQSARQYVRQIMEGEPLSLVPRSQPSTQQRKRTAMTFTEKMLKLNELIPAPWNPRKTVDADELKGLVGSMADHGLLQPLTVRWLTSISKFEIVAGYRRYLAADKLTWNTIRCFVRELDDDEARKIAIIDNLQRSDVPALEEADGYNDLRERVKSIQAVAAAVGKPVAYVTQRLQLVTLAELPRKALAEKLIAIDHALLFARLGEAEQNLNLKWCLKPGAGVKEKPEDVLKERLKDNGDKASAWRSYYEPQSVLKLKHHIEQNVGRKLSRAPWNLDDAELMPSAGACNVCPSNTKANDALFSDLNISGATCENGACFEAKRAAFVQIKFSTIAENHSFPGEATLCLRRIKVSWKSTTVKPRIQRHGLPADRDGFAPEQIFREGQWREAKPKSCEFARAAVTVDWSDADNRGYMGSRDGEKLRKPGQVITVCIAEKCKVHKKSYLGEKRHNSSTGGYDPKAEAEKREKKRVAASEESKIRMAAATKAIEQVRAMPDLALRMLILKWIPDWADRRKPLEELVPGLLKIVQTAKIDSVEFARAVAVASIDSIGCYEQWESKTGRSDFLASLKRLGYDGSGAWVTAKADAKVETKEKAAAKKVARKSRDEYAAGKAKKKPAKKKAAKKAGK